MRQTAVEWLGDQIDNLLELYPSERQGLNKAFEQAKEMEKEQIIEARINGDVNGACIFKIAREKAEQYYTETFKSE